MLCLGRFVILRIMHDHYVLFYSKFRNVSKYVITTFKNNKVSFLEWVIDCNNDLKRSDKKSKK